MTIIVATDKLVIMEQTEYRLAAIMYTDIQGFSRMMERDEKATIKLLELHNDIVRAKVNKYKGNVIKTIGDAFLVDFRNTVDAVACALEIQQEIKEHNDRGIFEPLLLRIGVHLGDIYFYENDALGEGINIASRLQSKSKAGAVCISQDVYNQIQNKIQIEAIPLGPMDLKNITKEVKAYHLHTDCFKKYGDGIMPGIKTSQETKPADDFQDRLNRAKEIAKRIREKRGLSDESSASSAAGSGQKDREYDFGDDIERFISRIPEGIKNAVQKGIHHLSSKEPEDLNQVSTEFPSYKNKVGKSLAAQAGGLVPHAISYFAVNTFLFRIGINTGPFPWYYIVAASWGIGLISHVGSIVAEFFNKKEIGQIEELSVGQFKELKKHQSLRKDMISSAVSMFTVPALLYMINMMTYSGFLWFLFPTIPIVISSIAKISSYFAKKAGRLKKIFSGKKAVSAGSGAPSKASPVVKEAYELKESILKALKSFKKKDKTFGSDFNEVIEKYVTQIDELDRRNTEVQEIILQIPMQTLDADLASLTEKLNSVSSPSLQKEYAKSISEIEKQKKSYMELLEQKEVFDLRIKTAVNQLKKFSIDVVRLKNVDSRNDDSSSAILDGKMGELHQYLDDFNQGYNEMESLEKRFEELEKLAIPGIEAPTRDENS